jgi:hypothetical protein
MGTHLKKRRPTLHSNRVASSFFPSPTPWCCFLVSLLCVVFRCHFPFSLFSEKYVQPKRHEKKI